MIKSNSTIDAWKHLLRYLLKEGNDFIDKDGRLCREKNNIVIEIKTPEKDITLPIEKISSSKEWVYPRADEIANIALTRKYSPGHLYIYGQRIFNFDEQINQINKFIIPLLKKDPKSRRGVVSLWNPKIDANIFNKEVPSLMTLHFIVEENKINVTGIIRSNDVFLDGLQIPTKFM